MHKKHYILATLLATFCWEIAHARTQKSPEDEMATAPETTTPLTTPTTAVDPVHLYHSKTANSVVQDWISVCKQLCGAGFGGPICGPQCKIIQKSQKENQTERAKFLLHDKQDLICQDLCIFDLGGSICNCKLKRAVNPKTTLNRNMVCTTFCEHNELTLAGCSICQRIDSTAAVRTIKTTVKPFSTTPNWDQICVALCKTGDGGALCNCDLPPFL